MLRCLFTVFYNPVQNFKFSTIDLEVAFPKDYPTVPLSLTLPNDQGLHPIYITHGNQAVSRYLATAPGGSGELMFRPFIRWFDKTITSVFKDAAKQVRQELNPQLNVPIHYLETLEIYVNIRVLLLGAKVQGGNKCWLYFGISLSGSTISRDRCFFR